MSHSDVIVGVSLKMYLGYGETMEWCTEVSRLVADHPAITQGLVDVFLLPSTPAIPAAVEILDRVGIAVGAQDLWSEDRGSFTGEVGGPMLREIGCEYVAVGHAERRALFGEDDRRIGAKVAAAVRNQLIPVLCVGEPRRVESDRAAQQCIEELGRVLAFASDDSLISPVVAYEPIWAIGQDEPAPPSHIRAVAGAIKAWLTEREPTQASRLIYGGSASVGLLGQLAGSVDGLFLGRFAHDPDTFAAILDEAADLATT